MLEAEQSSNLARHLNVGARVEAHRQCQRPLSARARPAPAAADCRSRRSATRPRRDCSSRGRPRPVPRRPRRVARPGHPQRRPTTLARGGPPVRGRPRSSPPTRRERATRPGGASPRRPCGRARRGSSPRGGSTASRGGPSSRRRRPWVRERTSRPAPGRGSKAARRRASSPAWRAARAAFRRVAISVKSPGQVGDGRPRVHRSENAFGRPRRVPMKGQRLIRRGHSTSECGRDVERRNRCRCRPPTGDGPATIMRAILVEQNRLVSSHRRA